MYLNQKVVINMYRQVDELINEALESLLIDFCLGRGISEETAFVYFVQATQRRQGILRMASSFGVEGVESMIQLAPDAVMTVDRLFEKAAIKNEEEMVENAERAIMALFLGAMQAMGDHLITTELGMKGGDTGVA